MKNYLIYQTQSMKKIFFILTISLITISLHAQLANTKWKTTLQLDQPIDVVFSFTADTLDVSNADDHSSLETMKYTLQDTTFTIQKLYGQSVCDTTLGTYSLKITDNTILIKPISDNCSDRANVLRDIKLTKEE